MKPPSILITGSNGMLGRALVEACVETGLSFEAMSRHALDIADDERVRSVISNLAPSVVINAAAYTDVDGAESNPDAADRANHVGPQVLARVCRDHGVVLVHFSTDYVFSGTFDAPIKTNAATNPCSVYGRTKLAGERAVATSGCESLIIRTSWLFAATGRNFVRTMLRIGAERDSIKVVNDQRGRPTFAPDLARAALALIRAHARGVLHVANSGECTWYDFAREIMSQARLSCRAAPCTTSEFPRPAPRPAFSVLDLTDAERLIRPLRPWQDALADCIAAVRAEPPCLSTYTD